MIEDIGGQIDNHQYGSLKGTSTTLCLLEHNCLSTTGFLKWTTQVIILELAFWTLAKLSIE
jgi:hypothetical protein